MNEQLNNKNLHNSGKNWHNLIKFYSNILHDDLDDW